MNTNPELPLEESPGPDADAASPDILDNVEYVLYQAGGGKRFANLLIDTVIYYFAWKLFLAYWFAEFLIWLRFPLTSMAEIYLVAYGGALLFFGLMTAGIEIATGGKTIGKYVTGTRAVMDSGSRLTTKAAILRFLSREVPFEAFSALGDPSYPWHDRWTKTVVIDEKLTTLPPED